MQYASTNSRRFYVGERKIDSQGERELNKKKKKRKWEKSQGETGKKRKRVTHFDGKKRKSFLYY